MASAIFREFRHTYDMRQKHAAEFFGVTVRTWRRWEVGEGFPPRAVTMIINLALTKADLFPFIEKSARYSSCFEKGINS